MKKKFAFFIIWAALLCINIYASAQEVSESEKAQLMVDAVVKDGLVLSDTVKRAEFITAVSEVMKVDYTYSGKGIFNDVVESDSYYNAVNNAYMNGWISEAASFLPENPIKKEEAVKIIVNALNYKGMANQDGGYPQGYIIAAGRIGLLKRINMSDSQTLTRDETVQLLANALHTDAVEFYMDGKTPSYRYLDIETVEKIYNLKHTEGIVTDIEGRSITLGAQSIENTVKIDGEIYYGSNCNRDLLGYNVRAYYDEDNNIFVLIPQDTVTMEIKAEDFDGINDFRFNYDENGKLKNVKLDEAYKVIYNGKRVESTEDKYYKDLYGKFVLTDNNNDGRYDLIHIESYEYAVVDTIDLINGRLGVSGGKDIFDTDKAVYYSITNRKNEPVDLFRIKKGDRVAVKRSLDMELTDIIVLDSAERGKLMSYDASLKTAVIDSETYKLSGCCLENDMNNLSPGNNVSYYIGLDNDIVSMSRITGKNEYGYLLKISHDDFEPSNVYIKLLDSSGNLVIYKAADRVKLDGEKQKPQKLYTELGGDSGVTKQLIKYAVNDELLLTKVDRAKDGENSMYGEKNPEDDNLIKYADKEVLRYRNSPMLLAPNISIESSEVFVVPGGTNVSDEDYEVINNNGLQGDSQYTVDVYDVDEYGSAGAIVIYKANTNPIIQSSETYMVESVMSAVNDDNEQGAVIHCWRNGKFYDFFVTEDIEVTKKSGEAISSGDLIRVWLEKEQIGNKVKRIVVDVDYSSGKIVQNTVGIFNVSLGSGTAYSTGYVYAAGENGLTIAQSNDTESMVDFTWKNMRTCRAQSPYVAFYDKNTKKIETGKTDDIRTYIGYDSDCDLGVIRLTSDNTTSIYIYR